MTEENLITTLNGNKYYKHVIRDINLITTTINNKLYINFGNLVNSIRKQSNAFRKVVVSDYFYDFIKFYCEANSIEFKEDFEFNTVTDLVNLLPEVFFYIGDEQPSIRGTYGPSDLIDFILFKIQPEYSFMVHNLLQSIQDKADVMNRSFIETLNDQITELEDTVEVLKLESDKKDTQLDALNNTLTEFEKLLDAKNKEIYKLQQTIEDLRANQNINLDRKFNIYSSKIVEEVNKDKIFTKEISKESTKICFYISQDDLKFEDKTITVYKEISDKVDPKYVKLFTYESNNKIKVFEGNWYNYFNKITKKTTNKNNLETFHMNRRYLQAFLKNTLNHIDRFKYEGDIVDLPDNIKNDVINQLYIDRVLDEYTIYIDNYYRKIYFNGVNIWYIYKGEPKEVPLRRLINCRIRDYNDRPLGRITSVVLNNKECRINY